MMDDEPTNRVVSKGQSLEGKRPGTSEYDDAGRRDQLLMQRGRNISDSRAWTEAGLFGIQMREDADHPERERRWTNMYAVGNAAYGTRAFGGSEALGNVGIRIRMRVVGRIMSTKTLRQGGGAWLD